MPRTYVDYKPPTVETKRTYDVEGLAPDTEMTEGRGGHHQRTFMLRPRTLELRSRNCDPAIINHISLEGRQVRKKDGSLGNSRCWGWSASGWLGEDKPPAWILEIVEAEGLRYGNE